MQIPDQKKFALTDEVPMLLGAAYDKWATNSPHPCSLCREHPEQQGKRVHFHGSDWGTCHRRTTFKMSMGDSYHQPIVPYRASEHFLKDGHTHEATMMSAFDEFSGLAVFANYNEQQLIQDIPFWNPGKHPDVKEKIQAYVLTPQKKRFADMAIPEGMRRYKLVGHVDGIGLYIDPDTKAEIPFGIECKSVKEDTWKDVLAGNISDSWYGQMQCYMFLTGYDRWYLTVKNRVSSKMHTPIRINYDWKYAAKMVMRMNKSYALVNRRMADVVPVPKDKSVRDIECKFCSFAGMCWTTQ